MEFRRTGQRDERRRRVLIDELLTSPEQAVTDNAQETPAASADAATRRYSAAAESCRQPPVTCLIPVRGWTLAVLVLSGLTAIAGLETLYAPLYQSLGAWRGEFVALDLAARGSLASWFGSALLLLGSSTAWMVFWLRSHKLDDYRGRYRLWPLAALVLMLASIDVVTGLHAAVGAAVAAWYPGAAGIDFTTWTTGILASLLTVFAVRMLVEMWACRAAAATLILATAAFGTAAALNSTDVLAQSPLLLQMSYAACWLLGLLGVSTSVLLYCRFVYLDSQGLIAERPRPAKKPQKKRPAQDAEPKSRPKAAAKKTATAASAAAKGKVAAAAKTAKVNSKNIRVDAAHDPTEDPAAAESPRANSSPANSSPAESGKRSAMVERPVRAKSPEPRPVEPAPDVGEEDLDSIDPETGRPLSKAERRRQRKLQRRQARQNSAD